MTEAPTINPDVPAARFEVSVDGLPVTGTALPTGDCAR